jgi:hypothetical protein
MPGIEPRIVNIPYKPRFPQDVVHKELESHRFSVFVAHRRMGKSVMFVNHTLKKATQNKLRSPRYAFIAPFLKQAKMIAWDYFKRYGMVIPGTQANESDLSLTLPNKAKVTLFGADNPEAMRGTYFDGVVLDEYGQFKKGVFTEIIRPTLVDRRGWAVFGGTPKGLNEFYDIREQALKAVASGNTDWWTGLYRADETRVISDDELVQLKATLSDRIYRQEFLCDFSAEADNVLIPIDLVSAACARVIREEELIGAPKILGVDVARFGDDRSVIVRRKGLGVYKPTIVQKMDNMTLAGFVATEINKWKPDAVFIDAGRGEGVIDRLRQVGHRVQEVNFGGKPTESGMYSNKRTEMWDKMREWLEQGGVLPPMQEIKADLTTPTYDFDAANRMRLESKEDIKERLGRSPDIGDAIALTFAFPVQKHVDTVDAPDHQNRAAKPYNIFEELEGSRGSSDGDEPKVAGKY